MATLPLVTCSFVSVNLRYCAAAKPPKALELVAVPVMAALVTVVLSWIPGLMVAKPAPAPDGGVLGLNAVLYWLTVATSTLAE